MAIPVFARGPQYRKKLKEYKKEGWELFGSSKTMKDVLRNHYETLGAEGVFEVVGTAVGVKSESIGQQVAWNNGYIAEENILGNIESMCELAALHGIHPTLKGYKVLEEAVLNVLK